VVYLPQEPSALQVFLEKNPPQWDPTLLCPPGWQTKPREANEVAHFGLFEHLLVALPQGDLGGRLVQDAVQHLDLGLAAPASHSSVLSTTPFPQTAGASDEPATTNGG